MTSPPETRVDRLFREALVVDTHVHSTRFVPKPVSALFHWINRRTMPPDVALCGLTGLGVSAVVVNAVGDPVTTRWWLRSSWVSVCSELEFIAREATHVGARCATSADDVLANSGSDKLSIVLGLEGADAIGSDLSRLDELHARGVRVITPVHLGDNQLGTTCLPWQRYLPKELPIGRRRRRGLTTLGREAIERMNELGILVDLSHADAWTLRDILEVSTKPALATHTGARRIADFERFLPDDDIELIAESGGAVGLWPYRYRGLGVLDTDELIKHARHIAQLVGPSHICIGTDMNGVPGVMAGYDVPNGLRSITEHLDAAGFSESEVRGILGENFLRIFAMQAA